MRKHPFNWLIWVLVFGILAYWGSGFANRCFPQKNWVDVSDITLGVLLPGSKVEFPVTIYNSGARDIALKPIRTSCGCLAPDREIPVVLLTGKNVLNFVFSAPSSPGKIEQEILFFAEKGEPNVWTARIGGMVAADVWAVPSRLVLQCPDSLSTPTETFTLHYTDKNIKSITTSPASLECVIVQKGEQQSTYSITWSDELSNEVLEKGKVIGSVLFEFEETDQEALTVSVDLISKPKFKVNPASIELSLSSLPGKTLLRTIAVQKLVDGLSVEQFQVTPVCDGVRLVETRENGNYLFLTFGHL